MVRTVDHRYDGNHHQILSAPPLLWSRTVEQYQYNSTSDPRKCSSAALYILSPTQNCKIVFCFDLKHCRAKDICNNAFTVESDEGGCDDQHWLVRNSRYPQFVDRIPRYWYVFIPSHVYSDPHRETIDVQPMHLTSWYWSEIDLVASWKSPRFRTVEDRDDLQQHYGYPSIWSRKYNNRLRDRKARWLTDQYSETQPLLRYAASEIRGNLYGWKEVPPKACLVRVNDNCGRMKKERETFFAGNLKRFFRRELKLLETCVPNPTCILKTLWLLYCIVL